MLEQGFRVNLTVMAESAEDAQAFAEQIAESYIKGMRTTKKIEGGMDLIVAQVVRIDGVERLP